MGEAMRLEQIITELTSDLPWAENVRLVVGPLASRESVKDFILERADIIPSWAAGTFYEFCCDILNKSKVSVDKILTQPSQCDAIERIAATDFLKSAAPVLTPHLKSRQVSTRVARLLTHLEKFYAHESELDALVEYFGTRDANLGGFTKVAVALWRSGELVPWGEGHALRKLLEILENTDPGKIPLPKKIWLWGFFEFTALEEALLSLFSRHGAEVCLLVPEQSAEYFIPRCQAVGAHAVVLEELTTLKKIWEPHSVWDELEFLGDSLETIRAKGVSWNEITVFVPKDDGYKRFVRQKLHEWNVPLHDPTLTGAWKDNATWVWWRDLFKTMATGLKVDDVRAWLSPTFGGSNGAGQAQEFFKAAFDAGIHGGAGPWANLLKKHDLPALRMLVEGVSLFGRALDPEKFLSVLEKFIQRGEELFGEKLEGSDVVLEFARHLALERPYLENFSARLPRYIPLFEEFLENKSRTQSLRSRVGINFVGHGVWLPFRTKYAFVLGVNSIKRARPGADVWDWEALEVRRVWEKLHFGPSFEERVVRDEAFLLYGFKNHDEVVFSGPEYNVGGELLPHSALFRKIKQGLRAEQMGGHTRVGWLVREHSRQHSDEHDRASVVRPDLASTFRGENASIGVSKFEDYLKCPFLFLGRHILKLEKQEELGLDPDGRARGKVLHAALERMLALEINGQNLEDFDQAKQKLFTIIDEEIKTHGLKGMYRHKALIEKARSVIRAHAEKWLQWEFEYRKKHRELRPFAVEKSIELELQTGLRVRGKVDRVDTDGKHSVVIDYKTGSAPFIGKEIREGLGAQLVMYSRSVEIENGLEPAAAFYLTLGNQVKASNGIFLKKHQNTLHNMTARNSGLVDGEFLTLFERVSENWTKSAEALSRGEFTAKPSRPNKDCSMCSFEPICGYNTREDHRDESGQS